jgi:hypothetical protein
MGTLLYPRRGMTDGQPERRVPVPPHQARVALRRRSQRHRARGEKRLQAERSNRTGEMLWLDAYIGELAETTGASG